MHESQPIIVVGAPRSGTTIFFENFALHPDLAWISNYSKVFPRFPVVNSVRRLVDNRIVSLRGVKNQFNDQNILNKYLPRPDESYEFWTVHSRPNFASDYLLGIDAGSGEVKRLAGMVEKTRKYQGRRYLTAKLTGPGRINYLNSVWPEARFIHVIRNGLEVVQSLLNVHFWKHNGGYERPWWTGGLSDQDMEVWSKHDRDPGILAALQWMRIIETMRAEASNLSGSRYFEVKYEDFMLEPEESIHHLYQQVGLPMSSAPKIDFAKRNKQYSDEWSDEYRNKLIEVMQPVFGDLGYGFNEGELTG